MKVNLIGNTSNLHYRIAKNLRNLGVDARLFYDENSDPQNFPYWDEPKLKNNMPDWIVPYSIKKIGNHPLRRVSNSFLKQLSDCDILHVEHMGLIWAYLTGKPYIWDPFGWDLQFFPFYSFWQNQWNHTHRTDIFLAPLVYRRAIKKSSAIVYGYWYQFMTEGYKLINQLIDQDKFIHSIPMNVDPIVFSPGEKKSAQELLKEFGISKKINGLVIFHPTRIMFSENSYLNKGNDRLFNALARLKTENYQFSLVLGERQIPDEKIAKEMFKNLGLEDNVIWLPKMECFKLVEWFRAADIGADQFVGGALGLVSFETMSCGTPLLSYLKASSKNDTFWHPKEVLEDLPPIINASSEDEIYQNLKFYFDNPQTLAELGKLSREWVINNISDEIITKKYLNLYKRILKTENDTNKGSKVFINSSQEIKDLQINKRDIYNLIISNKIEEAKALLVKNLDLHPEDPELVKFISYILLIINNFNLFKELKIIWSQKPHFRWAIKKFFKKLFSSNRAALEMLKYSIEIISNNCLLEKLRYKINKILPIIIFFRIFNFRVGLIYLIQRLEKSLN